MLSTRLKKFAGIIVDAGKVKIIKTGMDTKVSSGDLTLCTVWIADILGDHNKVTHVLVVHAGPDCTSDSIVRNVESKMVEEKISGRKIQTVAFRCPPGINRPNPDEACLKNTLTVVTKASNLLNANSGDTESMTGDAPIVEGHNVAECTFNIRADGTKDIPVDKGIFTRCNIM